MVRHALAVVLLAASWAHAGDVDFEVVSQTVAETQLVAQSSLVRTSTTNNAGVHIEFGGTATLGEDYEAYAVSRVANPAAGSGLLGTSVSAWGTNLMAVSGPTWGIGGAVVLLDGMGNVLGVASNPAPDLQDSFSFTAAENFGNAIAFLSSNLFVVCAEGDNTISNDTGAIHLFAWNGSNATHLVRATEPGTQANDRFGSSVVRISSNRFLVGAVNGEAGSITNAGAMHMFTWTGSSLVTNFSQANPVAANNDAYGRSVGILSTNILLAGDPFADGGGFTNHGILHVFQWNGTGSATYKAMVTNPTPVSLDQFGFATAGVGTNLFVVTANRDSTGATNTGAAYLYEWTGSGVTLLATITNPSPGVADEFGSSVAAVGTRRFVIGALRDDETATDSGSAWLYEWDGTNAVLLAPVPNPTPAVDDRFGTSAAGIDESTFLVGAPQDNTFADNAGSAHVFRWDGTNAILLRTLTARAPANFDGMGSSVAGLGIDRFAVGALSDGAGIDNDGAVHVFEWSGTGLVRQATITSPSTGTLGQMGFSLDNAGSFRLIAGAPFDTNEEVSAGRAYLFATAGTNVALLATVTNPSPAVQEYFGWDVSGLGPGRFIVGAKDDNAGADNTGAAYVYEWNGTDATLLAAVTNPTPAPNDRFGVAVDNLGTNRFVVGSLYDDEAGTDTGAAYLYQLVDTNVVLLATVPNPDPLENDEFGGAVAGMSATRFAVGAPYDAPDGFDAVGSVHLYEWTGSNVIHLATVTNPSPDDADFFGAALDAPTANRLVVGTYQDGDRGTVSIYDWTGTSLVLRETLAYPAASPYSFQAFGSSIATVGGLGLVVGSPSDTVGGEGSGGAWLYRAATSGEPLLVEFEEGAATSSVQFILLDDARPEPTNTIVLTLGAGFGVDPVPGAGSVISILDDDPWAIAASRPFRFSTNQAAIVWTDMAVGTTYTLESTTNLAAGPWQGITSFEATGTTHTAPFPFPTNATIEAFRLLW